MTIAMPWYSVRCMHYLENGLSTQETLSLFLHHAPRAISVIFTMLQSNVKIVLLLLRGAEGGEGGQFEDIHFDVRFHNQFWM